MFFFSAEWKSAVIFCYVPFSDFPHFFVKFRTAIQSDFELEILRYFIKFCVYFSRFKIPFLFSEFRFRKLAHALLATCFVYGTLH